MRILAALIGLLVTPAFAQDWSGPYAGLTVGHGSGGVWNSLDDITYSGTTAGTFLGWRFDANPGVVWGLEMNATTMMNQRTMFNGEDSSDYYFANAQVSGRLTAGISVGRLLPYIGVGAVAGIQGQEIRNPFLPSDYDTQIHPGAELLAGVDAALTDRIFARVEASISMLGSADYYPWSQSIDMLDQVHVRAGIGFKY